MRSGPRLYLRHHVIWYYTFGQNSPKKLTPSHANLLHFVRSPSNAVWYPESVRIPSAREEVYNDRRAKPGGRLPDDTWIIRPTDPRAGFEDDHSVWHVPRICGTFHQKADTPNQIPEQILGRIIRFCTKPGDLVLDCFSGSGTTPATAKKLGRRYLGIEQSPVYFEQGKIRVDGVNVGDPLDGSNLPEPPRTRNSSPCPTPVVPSPIPTTPELPPIRPPRRRASGSTP
jgi:site-specific DNA-methyltransferase (adenine-specific)